MEMPLQIAFEGIQHSDAIEARIKEEMAKLEQFSERITSARVVIARPQHRHHKGDIFHVRIHLVVPDAPDITVSREPGADGAHEDCYVTIRDAFKAARRVKTEAEKFCRCTSFNRRCCMSPSSSQARMESRTGRTDAFC